MQAVQVFGAFQLKSDSNLCLQKTCCRVIRNISTRHICHGRVRQNLLTDFPPGFKGDGEGLVPETLGLVVQGSRVAPRCGLVQLG